MNSKFNPEQHHRRSIRLKEYNYTWPGGYFVTICVHNKKSLFGCISDGTMVLNIFGKIAHEEWMKTGHIRSNITMDDFVLMPNHMHGIIVIHDSNCRGMARHAPTSQQQIRRFGKPLSKSLSTIIGSYKSAVTKRINEICCTLGSILWQRNYFERVIRDERELNTMREYIRTNPERWADDDLYIE